MIERVLLHVAPDVSDETVLAYLAAFQAYEHDALAKVKGWNKTHRDNKQLELELYINCPDRYYFLFERCLSKYKKIESMALTISMVDVIVQLSVERALAICDKTDKPLAQGIGILIGAESSTLPDVSNLVHGIPFDGTFLIDEALNDDNYFIMANNIFGSIRHFNSLKSEDLSILTKIEYVIRARAILGYSSFETYLASAMGKPVFEIQENKHLRKWSNKKYVCVTNRDRHAIEEGVKLCLSLSTEESTQMAQGISGAVSVETI